MNKKLFKRIRKFHYTLPRYFRWVVLFLVLSISIWGVFLPNNVKIHWNTPHENINSGWVQVIDDKEYDIPSAQEIISIPKGESIILKQNITTKDIQQHLLFYAEHQEVYVYVDNELLYSLVCPEYIDFFGSPGRMWVDVPLPVNLDNSVLTLEFNSRFKPYQVTPSTIYRLNSRDIQDVQIRDMWIRNTAALILFALAIISYINATIWKNRKLRKYLCTMGDFYLMITLWVCCEINVISMLIGTSSVASLLAMIFIRIMPIACYHVCAATCDNVHPWWLKLSGHLVWFEFIISIILQFVFKISLVSQLPIHTCVVVFSSSLCIFCIIHEFYKKPHMREHKSIYFAIIIMLIASILEAMCYISHEYFGHYSGLAISLGGIIYATVVHMLLVRKESITDIQKRELEAHYKILQKKPLTQQINAHFLSNTLNTISAYCKEDPIKADKAVQLLARYMREFMHSVNQSEYATFEDEIDLVKMYLDIVNLRFGNVITLKLENEYNDFLLPPLCLQPLVENAAKHGIRSTTYKGIIKIKTRKVYDMAEVNIMDNGRGFETDKANSYMGVSLANISSRINALGGTMKVESILGQGTMVTLRVPIDLEEDYMI